MCVFIYIYTCTYGYTCIYMYVYIDITYLQQNVSTIYIYITINPVSIQPMRNIQAILQIRQRHERLPRLFAEATTLPETNKFLNLPVKSRDGWKILEDDISFRVRPIFRDEPLYCSFRECFKHVLLSIELQYVSYLILVFPYPF